MSHYASSHNVVFKITVPKRTGRKRKRGSDDPWQGDIEEVIQEGPNLPWATLRSQAKLDEARILRRKLQDNVDRYHAEAVGVIKHTHRYRGMVDFNHTMKNNEFMNNFTNTILSADSTFVESCSLKPSCSRGSQYRSSAPSPSNPAQTALPPKKSSHRRSCRRSQSLTTIITLKIPT